MFGTSDDPSLNLPFMRDPPLTDDHGYAPHSVFGGAHRFFPQIAASDHPKGAALGKRYDNGRCILWLTYPNHDPGPTGNGAFCMNDQGQWNQPAKCEIFSNGDCSGSGVADWAAGLNQTAIAGANALVDKCVRGKPGFFPGERTGWFGNTDSFWNTPWCVKNYKHSAFLSALESAASGTPNRWADPKIQDYCRTPYFASRRNEASCHAGYREWCKENGRWMPPEYGGDARCWEYAQEKQLSISDYAKTRCQGPGALSDPFCFGANSYVCSTNSNEKKEFQRGNRYDWCNDTFRSLCLGNNYANPLCACERPYSTKESAALVAIGAANRSRYCVTTPTNPQWSEECRTSGYRIDPHETCQSICSIQASANYGVVSMSDVKLLCADGTTLSLPPKFTTLDEMITWWVANKAQYRETGSPPTQQDIANSFATQITNYSTATLTELRAIESKMNAIPTKLAADTHILNAITARIAAMELAAKNAVKYEYTVTTEKRRIDLHNKVNIWMAADYATLLSRYPVGTPFFFTRGGKTFQAVFNAWTDAANTMRSITISKQDGDNFVAVTNEGDISPLTFYTETSGGSGVNEVTIVTRRVKPAEAPAEEKEDTDDKQDEEEEDEDDDDDKKTTTYLIIGVVILAVFCFMMMSMGMVMFI